LSERSGKRRALYERLTGVSADRLSGDEAALAVGLGSMMYFAYRRGFWAYIRGVTLRPRLRECRGRFFVGRSPNILFPGHLSVGRNVYIGDYVYMNCLGAKGVSLGDNVRIREFGWVQVTAHLSNPGEGLIIGTDTYIGPHSVLGAGGFLRIGNDVTMGAYVQLLAENHNFDDGSLQINRQGVVRRGITVEDDCWLGNGVIVTDGVTIGTGSVIGAGAVVVQDVPPRSVCAGNPARVIRARS
jgi:acetyltransferase-like isoleucine patch superfamily enzyme